MEGGVKTSWLWSFFITCILDTMNEAYAPAEKSKSQALVEETLLQKDALLDFLEERATDPKNAQSSAYAECYSQLATEGKMRWETVSGDLLSELDTLEFLPHSREAVYAAFFDNGDFDPLFYLEGNQLIDEVLYTKFKESPQEPSDEFVELFRDEFVRKIKKVTDPKTMKNDRMQSVISSIKSRAPIDGKDGSIYDAFVGLCQAYRLGPDFTEKLAEKLRWE